MNSFLVTVIAGLTISFVSGVIGYLVRTIKNPEKYLPKLPKKNKKLAYELVDACRHEYHYTRDTRYSESPRLAHGKIELHVKSSGIVEGKMAYDLGNRHGLSYQIRGEASNGRMSYTSVCEDDPSDVYSTLFTAILDPKIVGQMVGIDYQRVPYASPIVLSDKELTEQEVAGLVKTTNLALYGFDKNLGYWQPGRDSEE